MEPIFTCLFDDFVCFINFYYFLFLLYNSTFLIISSTLLNITFLIYFYQNVYLKNRNEISIALSKIILAPGNRKKIQQMFQLFYILKNYGNINYIYL